MKKLSAISCRRSALSCRRSAFGYQLSAGGWFGNSMGIPGKAAIRAGLSFGLILAALPLWAATPLAMRVDVRPTAITADGTEMTLKVQVAPQDRGRIGRQARMRVKLDRHSKTIAHILSDIDFDTNGTARKEFTWPPGTYELTLTIESLHGATQGLWAHSIEVPESLDQIPISKKPKPTEETTTAEPDATPPPPKTQPTALAGGAAAVATQTPTKNPEGPGTTTAPLEQKHIPAVETLSPVPEHPEQTPAIDPSLGMAPDTEPTPAAHATDDAPVERPVVQPSGPVFALVLDIDPVDAEIADRTADLRGAIERRLGDLTPVIIQPGTSDPTLGINQVLDVLKLQSDARAIVLITDGRRTSSRSDWKNCAASTRNAGIPVFVFGLWNDQFDPGTRRQLSRLAKKSGGRSYVLQPAESPARALAMLEPAQAPNS